MGSPIVQIIHNPRLQPIVTTAPALAAAAARLATQPRIGLDTEFLRERTYRAQLCLLQIAAPTEALCVDPLALTDLAPLDAVLTASSVLKVMHASRQDLEVLLPVAGLTRPVFDTQIAASLTGLPAQVGYADAVRRLLGTELAKSHTRTDWSRRPLSAAQVEYALDDVRYLLPLAHELESQLERLGRLEWLREDLTSLADAGRTHPRPAACLAAPQGPARARPGARAPGARARRLARAQRDRPQPPARLDPRRCGAARDGDAGAAHARAAGARSRTCRPGLVRRRGAELLECVRQAQVPDPAAARTGARPP